MARTLATIRARKYREGVMTYRNGMHIHQYVTLNQAQQYRAIGDQKHALLDLYHVLLHNGLDARRIREPGRPLVQPHAGGRLSAAARLGRGQDRAVLSATCWSASTADKRGLEKRPTGTFTSISLISPAWIQPGKQVAIRNAPTEMGRVSSTLTFTADGAELTVRPDFHHPPRHIVVRVPYSVELESFTSDATRAFREGANCSSSART